MESFSFSFKLMCCTFLNRNVSESLQFQYFCLRYERFASVIFVPLFEISNCSKFTTMYETIKFTSTIRMGEAFATYRCFVIKPKILRLHAWAKLLWNIIMILQKHKGLFFHYGTHFELHTLSMFCIIHIHQKFVVVV